MAQPRVELKTKTPKSRGQSHIEDDETLEEKIKAFAASQSGSPQERPLINARPVKIIYQGSEIS